MANKASLQTDINTKLGDSPLIIPSVHRSLEDSLLINSYGTVINETLTGLVDTTTNTTPNSTSKFYTINYTKQGRNVSLNGNLTNKTGAIVSNSIWFTFDATDYSPSSTDIQFNGYTSTGTIVRCQIQGVNFKVLTAIGVNQQIYFDTKYFTLN
jgi:hypothetical protein